MLRLLAALVPALRSAFRSRRELRSSVDAIKAASSRGFLPGMPKFPSIVSFVAAFFIGEPFPERLAGASLRVLTDRMIDPARSQ